MATSFVATAILRGRPRILLCSLDPSAPCAAAAGQISRRRFQSASLRRQREQLQEDAVPTGTPEAPPASSSSSRQDVSPSEFLASVMLERTRTEVERPSLAALDELDPHNSSSSRRKRQPRKKGKRSTNEDESFSRLNKNDAEDAMLFAHAFENVDSAFRRSQLLVLANEARLRGMSKSKRKEEIIRAILTQRFGLRDPQTMVESERKKRTALLGNDTRTETVRMRPHELFLFATSGHANSLARMRLAPSIRRDDEVTEGEPDVVLSLTGSEARLTEATRLIDGFKDNIAVRPLDLFKLRPDASRAYPILPQHIQAIAQTSRCYIHPHYDETTGLHKVSLYSFRPADANLAQELLRQHQEESALALARPLLTLKDDSPLIREAQFAMLPHVPPYPISLFHHSSSTDSTFRVREVVDRNAPRAGVGSEGFLAEGELGGSTIREGLQDSRSGEGVTEPFEWLKRKVLEEKKGAADDDELDWSMEDSPQWSFSATLGHALFSSRFAPVIPAKEGGSARTTHIQLLLDPPLPSLWPLAHLTRWTRTSGASASPTPPLGASVRTPFFCPVIPPGGMHIRSKGWFSSHAAGSQSTEQCVLEEVVRLEWASGKDAGGWTLSMEWVEEVVRDTDEKGRWDAEFDGIGKAMGLDDFSTRLVLRKARWCKEKEADVLSPETPTDLRLTATQSMPAWSELEDHPSLRSYMEALNEELSNTRQDTSSKSSVSLPPPIPLVQAGRPMPPSDLVVPVPGCGGEEQTLVLRSAKRINRTTWTLATGRGFGEDAWDRAIVEEATAVDGRDGMQTSLRMEWHPAVSQRDQAGEVKEIEPEPPRWRTVVHQLDPLMKTPYTSMAR